MPQNMRTVFLVHAVVVLVFGLGLFLIPGAFLAAFDWTPVDATISRFFGAALVGIAASSYMAYRAQTFAEVRVKLWLEMVFGVLSALAGLYQLLFADAPGITWLLVVILGGFGAIWIYFYQSSR